MIARKQHGFVKNKSTTSNLFCITEFISAALDNHFQVDVIYTHFSKALDELKHEVRLINFLALDFTKI